jgi:hypothetical protein
MRGLRDALLGNGYSPYTIRKAFNRIPRKAGDENAEEVKSRGTAFLPYVHGTTDRIGRLLKQHHVDTVFRSDRKMSSMFRSIKDTIPHESHGVYEVPCGSCEKTYIGQTNRKISARIAEHQVSVRRQETTSTLAMHAVTEGHKIDFENAKTLARVDHLVPRVYREAIEIEKREHSLNTRDDARRLPATWKPVLTDRRVRPAPVGAGLTTISESSLIDKEKRTPLNKNKNNNKGLIASSQANSPQRRITRSQTRHTRLDTSRASPSHGNDGGRTRVTRKPVSLACTTSQEITISNQSQRSKQSSPAASDGEQTTTRRVLRVPKQQHDRERPTRTGPK